MALAIITHPVVGAIGFLTAVTPSGWPIDQACIDEEELKSPGVDGVRYRTISAQHHQVQMTTLMDALTYDAAIVIARTYYKTKDGRPVILTAQISGVNYRFQNVHILDVVPQVRAGLVTGFGATAGSTAHVVAVWQLKLMDTTTTGAIG